jgi:hypothetical protein
MKLYGRGIFLHVLVWLVWCILIFPFIFRGVSIESLQGWWLAPLFFAVGLLPLCIGSAVWMLLFLLPPLRFREGIFYHLWIALGAVLAILCSLELPRTDSDPSLVLHYWLAAIVAFALGFSFSGIFTKWARGKQA